MQRDVTVSSGPASGALPSHEFAARSHLRPITAEIPLIWTAEQALAVYEMLDELREKVSRSPPE
jgi:hypothetical protein